jgi:hypothetical protein
MYVLPLLMLLLLGANEISGAPGELVHFADLHIAQANWLQSHLQVPHTGAGSARVADQGGRNSLCSSLDGSQDSEKENSGSNHSSDARRVLPGSNALGSKSGPGLDFTHSPLISGIGVKHAAVPALHLHQARYADMFGDDADDEDAMVPDTERGVRWSLRTPPKCNEFLTEAATYVSPLVLPQPEVPPASIAQHKCASVRSIHASSPSPLRRRCTGTRVSPSPIHVLPQPDVESSTPNMGTGGAAARAGTGEQHRPYHAGPERLSIRTPFVEAVKRVKVPNPPATPTFAAQRPTRPTAVERWDIQSLLEVFTDLQQQSYEAYSCFAYNIRTAVVPWQTVVLLALAVGWAVGSTWCALLSTVACIIFTFLFDFREFRHLTPLFCRLGLHPQIAVAHLQSVQLLKHVLHKNEAMQQLTQPVAGNNFSEADVSMAVATPEGIVETQEFVQIADELAHADDQNALLDDGSFELQGVYQGKLEMEETTEDGVCSVELPTKGPSGDVVLTEGDTARVPVTDILNSSIWSLKRLAEENGALAAGLHDEVDHDKEAFATGPTLAADEANTASHESAATQFTEAVDKNSDCAYASHQIWCEAVRSDAQNAEGTSALVDARHETSVAAGPTGVPHVDEELLDRPAVASSSFVAQTVAPDTLKSEEAQPFDPATGLIVPPESFTTAVVQTAEHYVGLISEGNCSLDLAFDRVSVCGLDAMASEAAQQCTTHTDSATPEDTASTPTIEECTSHKEAGPTVDTFTKAVGKQVLNPSPYASFPPPIPLHQLSSSTPSPRELPSRLSIGFMNDGAMMTVTKSASSPAVLLDGSAPAVEPVEDATRSLGGAHIGAVPSDVSISSTSQQSEIGQVVAPRLVRRYHSKFSLIITVHSLASHVDCAIERATPHRCWWPELSSSL